MSKSAPAPRLDLATSPAPQSQGGMDAAAGRRERADDRRPDLAAVPRRGRRRRARPSRRCRASSVSASTRRCATPSARSKLDIPAIAFFPYTDASLKDELGSEAFNEHNLVCKACRAIKNEFPELGLVTDVALDPYTSHGHDGLMAGETILNDESVAALVRQALTQAPPAPT